MKLQNIIVETGVVRSGMSIRDVFRECIRCQVPRLPFVDDTDTVIGCISIRHTLLQVCIPDYVIAYADLLGDQLGCLNVPEQHAREVLNMPAERFIIREIAVIDPDAPVVKAIAVMEKHDSNHVFVLDGGRYRGMITIDGIARRMLEIDAEHG